MYDFANSGYTTVVITAVFNAYFVGVVAAGESWATFAWTLSLAVSYAATILLGPLIGTYADRYGRKKRLLMFTTIGCVTFTAALSLVGSGDIWLAIVLGHFTRCVLTVIRFRQGKWRNIVVAH